MLWGGEELKIWTSLATLLPLLPRGPARDHGKQRGSLNIMVLQLFGKIVFSYEKVVVLNIAKIRKKR